MSTMADKFEELGVIPVVVLNDVKDALPLAKALYEGGLPCAEVTFRTAAAEESIRVMHEAYPDMVLAAGTVLTTKQVDRAAAGGLKMIKAMCAAYTNVRIMPTGGINAKNISEYLECDKIFCCGGSWMVKGDMIKAGEFDKIKDMTAEAVSLVKKIRG